MLELYRYDKEATPGIAIKNTAGYCRRSVLIQCSLFYYACATDPRTGCPAWLGGEVVDSLVNDHCFAKDILIRIITT